MVAITTLAKIYFTKSLCNTNIAGVSEIFYPAKLSTYTALITIFKFPLILYRRSGNFHVKKLRIINIR